MIGRRFTSAESLRSSPPSSNERRSLLRFFQNRRAIDSPDPYFAVMFEKKITGHIYRLLLFVLSLITVLLSSFHGCCLAGELYCGRLLSPGTWVERAALHNNFPPLLNQPALPIAFQHARAPTAYVRALSQARQSLSYLFISLAFGP